MADKHIYDEKGNYKGRISDAPPGDGGEAGAELVLKLLMAIIKVMFILAAIGVVFLFILSPGIAFNWVADRKVGDHFTDIWTWIIAIATWAAVFYLVYLVHKKAKKL